MTYLYILLGVIAAISFVTFITYGVDKLKAKMGAWRISEAALLTLSALGGGFGGIIAMLCFRHKIRRWYFWAINVIACVVYAFSVILFYVYVLPNF